MTLNYTPLRHRMLAEIVDSIGTFALYCANVKRAVWRPCRFGYQGVEVHLSAAEPRAVAELWQADLLHTPKWDGDPHSYRVLYETDAGVSQRDVWTAQHRESQ